MVKKHTKSKTKPTKAAKAPAKIEDGLWVAPRYSLKGPTGERAWENRRGGAPSNSRFLELADIAMGITKPEPLKKRVASSTHDTAKTEPYSEPK
jgi:hypothetical protein